MKCARLKGLTTRYINLRVCEKDMAIRNDGHPSSDHDLKRRTSSADPHLMALKTYFRLDLPTRRLLLQLILG